MDKERELKLKAFRALSVSSQWVLLKAHFESLMNPYDVVNIDEKGLLKFQTKVEVLTEIISSIEGLKTQIKEEKKDG